MIVKVQVELLSKEPRLFIYNKSSSYWFMGSVSKEVMNAMGDELKKFFYASVDRKTNEFILGDEAPWQDW